MNKKKLNDLFNVSALNWISNCVTVMTFIDYCINIPMDDYSAAHDELRAMIKAFNYAS